MQAEKAKEINGCNATDGSNPNAPVIAGGNSASQAIAAQSAGMALSEDSFYEKLGKFYESSGLSLVFNFRETSLDLYLFYNDVTERGGYHQVTKDGSWGEVTSALNLKTCVLMSPVQLQKLYASLFYQFEQTYYYRTPAKLIEGPGMQVAPIGHSSGIRHSSSCSIGKRKHCDSSHLSKVHSGTRDGQLAKRECNNNSSQLSADVQSQAMPGTEEKKLSLQTSSKVKEMKKDPDAPLGLRNSYQIFIKMECDRLKKIHGESSVGQFRNMAIEGWKRLSEIDRQPYIEASRKDRERFNQEMAAYEERKNKQNTKTQNTSSSTKPTILNFALASQTDGDYHVTSHPEAENISVSDESMVKLAVGLMKNARSNDPVYQINWDEYRGSLHMPS